jgi:hypothetical protein
VRIDRGSPVSPKDKAQAELSASSDELRLGKPISGRRSGCLTVNQVSQNKAGSDELEHYQRFPPLLSIECRLRSAECPDLTGRQISFLVLDFDSEFQKLS